jgi:hypothetical protein
VEAKPVPSPTPSRRLWARSGSVESSDAPTDCLDVPGLCRLCLSVAAQPRDGVLSSASLVRALSRALPFPAASDDGTPAGGSADPVWTVRWPEPDELRVEVVANPLNAKNREQALKVEREIQKAAMQSQSRSQGDYERAVSEFERTGRASGIREISLREDGLAGERYDADSQLTITATTIGAAHEFAVSTATMPAISDSIPGAIVVRVAANAYEEPATGDLPGALHYCPEQAWVFFGAQAPRRSAAWRAPRWKCRWRRSARVPPSTACLWSGSRAIRSSSSRC